MKTKIIVESFGDFTRLTLDKGQSEQDYNKFRNLAWGCEIQGERDLESFLVPKERFARIVKSFRVMEAKGRTKINGLGKMVKGKWEASPFEFKYVGQLRSLYRDLNVIPYHYTVSSFNKIHLEEHGTY